MSENQQQLVSVLCSVHDELRKKKSQSKDDSEWQQSWKEHTSDFKTLQEYSKAMHDLATKIWDPRNTKLDDENHHNLAVSTEDAKASKLKCRLEWVVRCCLDYFKDRLELEGHEKLRLLDVGSCYNPFSKFDKYFDIVAVDLCPAPGFEGEIFQCDFLELDLIDGNESKASISSALTTTVSPDRGRNIEIFDAGKYTAIRKLPTEGFEVVVFSYFLEYLADAKQRVESCRKAFKLLDSNGLLFILRPDSSKVTPGRNNALMKKMKVGMVCLGFKRIYFEKLEHLWCMAFKKLNDAERLRLMESPYFKKDVQKVGIEFSLLEDSNRIHELFYIAQDFKNHSETVCVAKSEPVASTHTDSNFHQILSEELPLLFED